jgi:hypothetical protein
MTSPVFIEEDIIFSYTRNDAIRDGMIIDISDTAKELGFSVPVGVTSAVWHIIEKKPDDQDLPGRVWDLLWMLHFKLKLSRERTDTVLFSVLMQSGRKKKWVFKAVIAASDPTGNPAITIMLPDED